MRRKKREVRFRLTKKEYRYVRKVARAMDRSVAYLVAHLLHEWFFRNENQLANNQFRPNGSDREEEIKSAD